MSHHCLLWTLLFCFKLSARATGTDSIPLTRSRVESMNSFIILKLTQSSDIEKIAVLTGSRDIRLSPNAATISRLSFSYRFIYVGVSYVPKFLPGNNDDAQKGKTNSGGFDLSLNFKHWINQFSYTRTKGYYLENTADFDPTWTPDKPYLQIPHLVLTQYQGLTAYNFNPNYSLNAITFQSERQLKSAGSFIPQFRYRYYINDDRSTPLPNGFTQKARNLELLIGAGYHYSFVMRERFYVSLSATPNAGYIFSHIITRSANETVSGNQRNKVLRLDGRAGAGYNSRVFFTGFYMDLSASAFNQQHTSVVTEDNKATFQVFIGCRLAAPKWMSEPVQKVEKILGMD